jgi:hypothetical protein
MKIDQPTVRVKYELQVIEPVCLEEETASFLKRSRKE